MQRKHPEIKSYILIAEYPGSPKLGTFEPYTTGKFSYYPKVWQPVYHDDVIRDKKLKSIGI